MERVLESGAYSASIRLTRDGAAFGVEVELTERIGSGAIYTTEAVAKKAMSRVLRELDHRNGLKSARASLLSGRIFQEREK